MRNRTANRNVSTAVTLILMFLLADVFVPSASLRQKSWKRNQPFNTSFQPSVQHWIPTSIPIIQTTIMPERIQVCSVYQGRAMRGFSSHSRSTLHRQIPYILLDLDLVCSNSAATIGLAVYPASTSLTWDENATWNSRNGILTWGEPGLEDGTDRSDWEPPIVTSPLGPTGGSSNVQLNVTALAQSAVASSASTLELVVSALGSQYECAMNETLNTADRPSLRVDSSTSTAGSGGITRTKLRR